MNPEESSPVPTAISRRRGEVRLVMISEVFYPELPGGLMRFYRYGAFLRERGIDVHVFTVKRSHHEEDELETNGIVVHRVGAPRCRNRDEERRYLIDVALRWHLNRKRCPTVFQMMAASGPKGAWRLWKARMRGVPTVYALTIVVDPPPVQFLPKWKKRILEKLTLSPFRRVFALSQQMKTLYVERLGIRSRRIEVIPNGVDLGRFHPAGIEEKREGRIARGIPADARLVLYVGALVERKRPDVVLEAWPKVLRRIPGAFLLLVGAQEKRPSHDNEEMNEAFSRYSEKVRNLAGKDEISGSVRIESELGAIEEIYRLADVFVLPSRLEGMPNVVLEAMASGVPPVVNGFEGLPRDGEEIGNEGEHFFRCDGGAEQWAEVLVSLLGSEDESKRSGEKARDWMERHQNLDKVTDTLARSYRELAGLVSPEDWEPIPTETN